MFIHTVSGLLIIMSAAIVVAGLALWMVYRVIAWQNRYYRMPRERRSARTKFYANNLP